MPCYVVAIYWCSPMINDPIIHCYSVLSMSLTWLLNFPAGEYIKVIKSDVSWWYAMKKNPFIMDRDCHWCLIQWKFTNLDKKIWMLLKYWGWVKIWTGYHSFFGMGTFLKLTQSLLDLLLLQWIIHKIKKCPKTHKSLYFKSLIMVLFAFLLIYLEW